MIDQENKYVISQQTKKNYYTNLVADEENDGEDEFNLNFI